MNFPSRTSPRRSAGFTLIELMIVVAVIGILTAIAYPSYVQSVQKARRTDAKTALLDFAVRQERYFSINNAYATTPDQLGYAGSSYPIDVLTGSQANYRLTASAGSTTAFAASAVPTGAQSEDPCGSFTINHLGILGNTGNTAGKVCW